MIPAVLIVSTTLDFSTDFVCIGLSERGICYLRLNRDRFNEYEIILNPIDPSMIVTIAGQTYEISDDSLMSIYYRAPTFLRDIYQPELAEDKQLYRSQWAAFIRNLIVFEKAVWINNPVDTYRAENKAYQLMIAGRIGFFLPRTLIVNHISQATSFGELAAIKSIDTAIVGNSEQEKFVYTQLYKTSTLDDQHFSSPFFFQTALTPKSDIRVTIVQDWLLAVKIDSEVPIAGDWRKHDTSLNYEIIELPLDVARNCIQFAKELNLRYCAIDLIFFKGEYYFIEVNPTGEWLFIQQNVNQRIHEEIISSLVPVD
ncbi:RimK-like protein [Siphonobacter aquaeclarae]|uniref:RimK-like ATP-grasp domain-containing protein n=1 Tax=Siphonobacter aquaeclarae TaxID=563176 RepID=A0A1G9K4L9_9BACT|nr:RimK-like protein [Siphonobacter aquaeclarae]SDL44698.1 hypothetical protein SAMN04488090_0877 [Siphonobacter aquaeclarae]